MDAFCHKMGQSLRLNTREAAGVVVPDERLRDAPGVLRRTILSGIGDNENPLNVDLDWCEFFVHVHDLPLSKMNFGVASLIGNAIGKFRDMEMDESGRSWGGSLRIRVAINVSQPLFRALRISTTGGDELVVSFTYERLQNFCYLCGRLGHISAYCELRFEEGLDPGADTPGPAVFGGFGGVSGPAGSSTGKGKGVQRTGNIADHHDKVNDDGVEVQSTLSDSLVSYVPVIGRNAVVLAHYLSPSQGTASWGKRRADLMWHSGLNGSQGPRAEERCSSGYGYSERDCESVSMEAGLIQGLGSTWTVRVLNELIRLHNPALVFLSETKCKKRKCEILKEKFNLFGINVDSQGKGGGLMLLWRKDINLVVHSFSHSHIDAGISNEEGTNGWRFTGLYGHPEAAKRTETWSLLQKLRDFSSRPWLCAGDFNEILSMDEKTGAPHPRRQIEEFRSCIADCQIMDLGCCGAKFTWCNRREAPNTVRVRLDRACASMSWQAMFPHTRVTTEAARGSDHNPLIINLEVEGTAAERVLQHLHSVREGLIGWDRTSFGHIRLRVKDIEDKLVCLESDPIRAEDNLLRSRLRRDLEETLSREEIMWKQRGKAQWLQEGDRNTPFFHARASARKRKNSIRRLRDNMGEWCSSREGIQHIISDYFLNLFRSSNLSEERMTAVLEGMSARVSDDMNEALIQPFSSEEVKLAISQCILINPRALMAERQGELRGVAVSRQGPRVSHLLFADDTLIFCQATDPAIRCIGRLLKEFEEASGLVVNLDKSLVAFSRNTPDQLLSILGVRVVEQHEKYLGLPALVGRSKREIFQNLKDRIWKRLQSWKSRNLSQAGKVVLLKSVVQAMPIYVMSCFLLPVSICRELESRMADFLWHNKDVRKIHWLSWDKLCASKDRGGLGLRKMAAFNKAMLAKSSYGLARGGTSVLGRVLRFGVIGGFLDLLLFSAYCLLSQGELISGHAVSAGSTSYIPVNWRFIWQIKVPPKVRMFVWRACRDSLPTSANLARRGVQVAGVCPWCALENEDLLHTLGRCHFARLVWALSHLPRARISCDHSNPEAWFLGMFHSLGTSDFARVLLFAGFYGGHAINCYLRIHLFRLQAFWIGSEDGSLLCLALLAA
ncbi:UNVERIFIED_CONTAM: hypothetical protein Slati_3682100 [Sesamum latifolium]|uniref:CCHC-type domain-containing protein n=1 Tax=Sesamum latifolium TaxID=2727402 RepID=A0AAW2U258_9LAMI